MDVLNNVLNPLKPSLQLITNNLPGPIDNIAVNLIGPECTASLVHNLDFSAANEACFKLGISKALGVAIISAASIVKIPQLLKLINSGSAIGLSFLSYVLETASYTVTLAYSIRNGFPFSTFGETAFIAIQDVAIATLILVYSGKSSSAAAFIAVFAAVAYALLGPGEIVDIKTLGYLQAGAGLLGLAAKVPQILTIWNEGSTGQLSAFAVSEIPILSFKLSPDTEPQYRSSTTSSVRSLASSQLSRRSTISSYCTRSLLVSFSMQCLQAR